MVLRCIGLHNYESKKGNLIDTEKTDVIYAADIETAKDIIKNMDLKYVKNPRGVSVFESIKQFFCINPAFYLCFIVKFNY